MVILHDAFEVMLLPRRVRSRLRIVRLFFRFTWLIWSSVARRLSSEDKRHICLSLYGPLSMVWLLVVWAAGLVAGFGTLYWVLDWGQAAQLTWPNQVYFSGVTFFTLGYGDVVPHKGVPHRSDTQPPARPVRWPCYQFSRRTVFTNARRSAGQYCLLLAPYMRSMCSKQEKMPFLSRNPMYS